MEESTGGEGQTTDSSGSDAQTDTSTGAPPEGCVLLQEAISIPRLDLLGPDASFGEVPCDVTDDGFLCVFDEEPELVEVDAAVEGFASLPWESGQSVVISGFGPDLGTYEASIVVRSTDDDLLGLVVWNLISAPPPFELELEDVGCGGSNMGTPLEATYSLGGDAVTLLGSGSAQLSDYTVFQSDAVDLSSESSGRLGQAATFAILLTP